MPAHVRPFARPWPLLALLLACGGSGSSTTDAESSTTQDPSSTSTSTSTSTEPTTSTSTSTNSTTSTGDLTDTGVGPTTGPTTDVTTTGDTTTSTSTTSSTTDGTSTTDDTTGDSSTTSTSSTTTTDTTTGEPGELGMLSGDCGLIDAIELESPDPFVFTGALDFGVLGYDYELLTPGGQQIYDEGNLNPGSIYSEIVAYEVLARCDTATLLKTEATIVYTNPMGKKTDFLAEIDGLKVGVSVVRAVGFPKDNPYSVAQAKTILDDKLADILVSSANVAPEDAWVKQILSVVAYGPMHLESLLTAYETVDPAIKADTLLVITVTDGNDAFIYQ